MSDEDDSTSAFALTPPPIDLEAERKAKKAADNKAWREANKDKLKAYAEGRRARRAEITEAYRQRHPDRVAAYIKRTKDRRSEYGKAYYQENKDELAASGKAYYEANKEQISVRTNAHYDANRPGIRAKQKAHYDANRERICARQRASYSPVKSKSKALLGRYGLKPEQYAEMFRQCGGRCECCKVPFSGILQERPNVDHCHKTNRVRGLICHRCNIALGHTNDDPKILRALARYLERQKE